MKKKPDYIKFPYNARLKPGEVLDMKLGLAMYAVQIRNNDDGETWVEVKKR